MMKRFLSLLIAAMLMLTVAACAESADGTALSAWSHEGGWISFATFAEVEELNDAWEAGAASLGAAMGMELTGDMLKAMNAQACGLAEDITTLSFDGDTITTSNAEGEVFSRAYAYVETIEDAIEGAPIYVYHTDDPEAGDYAYICLTLPSVASDEGGVITNFNLRWAAEDYTSLFAEDYEGPTGVLVWAETPVEDVDYTLRLIYGSMAAN